jgi:hypothetical protein
VAIQDRAVPHLVLDYGTRWARDGIVCMSAADGLRCVNDDGGELMLSRPTSRHDQASIGR